MSKETVIQLIKDIRSKPLMELEEAKKIFHEKYTVPAKLDLTEPFLYWKQLEKIITTEIVRRKLVINNVKHK